MVDWLLTGVCKDCGKFVEDELNWKGQCARCEIEEYRLERHYKYHEPRWRAVLSMKGAQE